MNNIEGLCLAGTLFARMIHMFQLLTRIVAAQHFQFINVAFAQIELYGRFCGILAFSSLFRRNSKCINSISFFLLQVSFCHPDLVGIDVGKNSVVHIYKKDVKITHGQRLDKISSK